MSFEKRLTWFLNHFYQKQSSWQDAWFISKCVVESHTITSITVTYHKRDGVSNHRRLDCLLSRLSRCISKDQRKHQSSASLAFVRVCRGHEGSITRKMYPFDDVTTKPIKYSSCENTVQVNSPPHSAAYMRQWTRSAMVQIMVCCLLSAKPITEPTLSYSQLDP